MSGCLLPPGAAPHVCDIRRRTVQVPDPAVGTDWSVQVPGSEAWDVRALFAQLQTSAVVANRGARLEYTDGTIRVLTLQPSNSQAAGLLIRYGLVPGGPLGSNAFGASVQWGGHEPFLLAPGYVLQVNTINLDVGDQWSQVALDVIFELNRGQGAARRYAQWREQQAAGLPDERLRSYPAGG